MPMSRWDSSNSYPLTSFHRAAHQAASIADDEQTTPTPPPSKSGVLIDGFRVSPAVPVILDDLSGLLPPGFNPDATFTTPSPPPTTTTTPEVPTVPTRGPRPTTRKLTTTTKPPTTTTTRKPFEFTPLPTEATTKTTTQKLYVSTNFFRPTLPTTPDNQEPETSSEIVSVETSSVGKNPSTQEKSQVSSQEPTVSSSSSFTKVKTTSSSQTSSTSSESNYNINNRLDELASNLDPWAHIQHAEHKVDSWISRHTVPLSPPSILNLF